MQQQQQATRAGPARRFLSDTDSLQAQHTPFGAYSSQDTPAFPAAWQEAATAAALAGNRLGTLSAAPHHQVQGLMQAAPKPVGVGIQFAGLPRPGGGLGHRASTTPGSPGEADC
jgi:hypothetical protein